MNITDLDTPALLASVAARLAALGLPPPVGRPDRPQIIIQDVQP